MEKNKIENDINIKKTEKLLKNIEKIENDIKSQMNEIIKQNEKGDKSNDCKEFGDWVIYSDGKDKNKTNNCNDKKQNKDMLNSFEIIDICKENEIEAKTLSFEIEA